MSSAELAGSSSEVEAQLQRILASPSFQSTPQLSALLSYLVDRGLAGRAEDLKATAIAQAVFGRDETFDAQTDTIVRVEAGRLRRRLTQYYEGSGSNDPLLVEIPKGGYAPRFSELEVPGPPQLVTSPVQPQAAPAHALTADSSVAAKWGPLLVVGMVVVALLYWWQGAREPLLSVEPSKPFIMVLPLAHDDSAIGQRVADRTAEAVISRLAKLNGISVMAYRSTRELTEEKLPLSGLRSSHGVSHVVDGRLDIHQNEVRAQVEIVDTGKGEAIWAEGVSGKLSDLDELQDLLSNRIATVLSVTLDPDQNERLYLRHSDNLEALELFRYAIRAIYPPDRGRLAATRDLFYRVTELDPEFAGGYAGLSLTHSYSVLFGISNSPQLDLEQAVGFANKAIAVDPGFGMGVAMLGVAHTLAGDTELGLGLTRQAIGLEPGEPLSHQWLALTLIRSGRAGEAVAAIKEALRLDPRDPQMPYLCILGMAHFALGQYPQATEAFEQDQLRGFRRQPQVYAMQAASYLATGDDAAARAMIPALNADLVAQQFPLEQWLGGMLTDARLREKTFSGLYRLGMLRPEQRVPAAALERAQPGLSSTTPPEPTA